VVQEIAEEVMHTVILIHSSKMWGGFPFALGLYYPHLYNLEGLVEIQEDDGSTGAEISYRKPKPTFLQEQQRGDREITFHIFSL